MPSWCVLAVGCAVFSWETHMCLRARVCVCVCVWLWLCPYVWLCVDVWLWLCGCGSVTVCVAVWLCACAVPPAACVTMSWPATCGRRRGTTI